MTTALRPPFHTLPRVGCNHSQRLHPFHHVPRNRAISAAEIQPGRHVPRGSHVHGRAPRPCFGIKQNLQPLKTYCVKGRAVHDPIDFVSLRDAEHPQRLSTAQPYGCMHRANRCSSAPVRNTAPGLQIPKEKDDRPARRASPHSSGWHVDVPAVCRHFGHGVNQQAIRILDCYRQPADRAGY